jgi:small subunit ribosomal protein S17
MVKSGNVGIPGVEPPKSQCSDKNCPFHGTLKVRGMVDQGVLIRYRADKMGTVEREFIRYDSKYKRYERRRSRLHVHIPPCIEVKEGDKVIFGETRPIAKSVSFVLLGKVS